MLKNGLISTIVDLKILNSEKKARESLRKIMQEDTMVSFMEIIHKTFNENKFFTNTFIEREFIRVGFKKIGF
jgi:hypothetical protein